MKVINKNSSTKDIGFVLALGFFCILNIFASHPPKIEKKVEPILADVILENGNSLSSLFIY